MVTECHSFINAGENKYIFIKEILLTIITHTTSFTGFIVFLLVKVHCVFYVM